MPLLTPNNSAHGQGIANDPHTNTVAKKAENAAAQVGAKELKAMRAREAKAQSEADARYARSLCMRAFDSLTDQPFRWARRLEANPYAKLRDLEQR